MTVAFASPLLKSPVSRVQTPSSNDRKRPPADWWREPSSFALPSRTTPRIVEAGQPVSGAGTIAITDGLERALSDSRTSFKLMVSRVSMHLGLEWLRKLFAQVDALLDVEEWDDRDPAPSQGTIGTFIRMLLILKVQRKPGMAVSNSGNLIAAWTSGANRLTVECFPGDKVRWSVARTIDGEVERAAGDGKIERLRDVLAPYQPAVWFEHAQ